MSVALVGCGRAGRIHLKCLLDLDDVVVSGLVDERESFLGSIDHTASKTTSLDLILEDPAVDAVVLATPTATHFELARRCLSAGKHVFVEKPIAQTLEETQQLYTLAAAKGRLLFTALNRRFDPHLCRLRDEVRAQPYGTPLHGLVVCRDFPFPPAHYLATCGGLFRDCACHDLDWVCHALEATPIAVSARITDDQETARVVLEFASGFDCTFVHSRHSDSYDQRAMIFCRRGCLQVENPPAADEALSFSARYAASYRAQMEHFVACITAGDVTPNVTRDEAERLERVLCACETSAAHGGRRVALDGPDRPKGSEAGALRTYDATGPVFDLYRKARRRQTVAHVQRLRATYAPAASHGHSFGVWEALEHLQRFVDVSDPDVRLPNALHAFQTAERLRRAQQPEWMQVVGLLHDCGKVLYLRGCDGDGTSVAEQWSIVGDTFVVGEPLPECLVYGRELNDLHEDDALHAYPDKCGLDACLVSYGHDEYLYQILRTQSSLPREGLAAIRYHSLYAWHTGGAYSRLENEYDRCVKGWVRVLNAADLYSKEDVPLSEGEVAELKAYYTPLVAKFVPPVLMW